LTEPGELWIGQGESVPNRLVLVSRRIGVTSAHDLPLRYFVKDSPFVSRSVTGSAFRPARSRRKTAL
jgi:3-methyladenine DNA glycosylase Mpg